MTQSEQNGPAGVGESRRLSTWLIWLALAAALIVAAFLLPWGQVWAALARADGAWIAAAFAICLAAMPVAAALWWLFLPRQYRLGWSRVFEITSLTVMARATLPFFAGDASAIGLLVMRGGLNPGAAVLVLTLDQLFTGLGKLAMICAVLSFGALPPALVAAGTSVMVLVLCFSAAMIIAAVYGHALHGLAEKFPARLQMMIRKISDLTAHLEMLRDPSRTTAALILTLIRKSIEVGVTLAVQHAVGLDLPLWNAILLVAVLDLAAVIPGPPAGLGVFEAAGLFTYHYLGVPPGIGFAAAMLQHAVYLGNDFLYGYGVLLLEGIRRKARGKA